MPRPIVLGNGNLLVGLDAHLQIRDFYFPYVGLTNHVLGHLCRMGVWDGEETNWLGEGWEGEVNYEPYALIAFASFKHRKGIKLFMRTAVHPFLNVFLREIEVESSKPLRFFLHHDFSLLESDIGDTAFYNPFLDGIIHFKRDIYLLISSDLPISQYAINRKGVWKDAEDGKLSQRSIEQGAVESIFALDLPPCKGRRFFVWIVAGHNFKEIERLQEEVRRRKEGLLEECQYFWHSWLRRTLPDLSPLPEGLRDLFVKSLLILRSHIDNRGAIIASTDSDIMQTARAHYAYMWGRDSAYTVLVLNELGQIDISRRFFLFVKKLLADSPFLWHKYFPDGSLGSSWHPWLIDGKKEVPLQEDSTAIVLYALGEHLRKYGDLEFLAEVYEDLVKKPALFMSDFMEPSLHLPHPSWNIWEEKRGVHLYTSALVALSLFSASEMSSIIGDIQASKLFYNRAVEIVDNLKRFSTGDKYATALYPSPRGWGVDAGPDASLLLIPLLNALPQTDENLLRALEEVEKTLWVKTDVGGMSRYLGDWYFRQSDDLSMVPGNPWFITTLWLAEWRIRRAKTLKEVEDALPLLLWAKRHALPSGVFPEQVHPFTGAPLSVAPLTWSHSAFLSAVLRYLKKRKEASRDVQ